MAFRPPAQQPDFSSLFASLAQTKAKRGDEALFQTIKLLIDMTTQFQGVTLARIDAIEEATPEDTGTGYPIVLGHSSL